MAAPRSPSSSGMRSEREELAMSLRHPTQSPCRARITLNTVVKPHGLFGHHQAEVTAQLLVEDSAVDPEQRRERHQCKQLLLLPYRPRKSVASPRCDRGRGGGR